MKSIVCRPNKSLRRAPLFYKIFYAEGKLLKSEKYALKGRPDIIFRNIITGRLIPAELKSGRADKNSPQLPKIGDKMQLVAYFLLAEEVYGIRPKKGYLQYADCLFVIKNTKKLRQELLQILEDMRDMYISGSGYAEPSFVKCRYCIAKNTVCEL